jgi:hypothetical protein
MGFWRGTLQRLLGRGKAFLGGLCGDAIIPVLACTWLRKVPAGNALPLQQREMHLECAEWRDDRRSAIS